MPRVQGMFIGNNGCGLHVAGQAETKMELRSKRKACVAIPWEVMGE